MKNHLPIPNAYFLVSSIGLGHNRLNAFDNALLNAGIGDLNLLKVSSILPSKATKIDAPKLTYGHLIPIAYVNTITKVRGTILSACVGIATDKNYLINSPGLIMEYTAKGITKEGSEKKILKMLEEGFQQRNRIINNIETISISAVHKKEKNYLCVFAGVVLHYI